MSGTIHGQSVSSGSTSSRELPKSLQGTEDADLVWGMITERFPNAAPLLCEMETVIDRAEDLLRQLRAPCHREIEVSTSFYTLDSEDSVSLIPTQESLANDDDTEVERCVAEAQVSVASFCDTDSLENGGEEPDDLKTTGQSVKVDEAREEAKEVSSLEKWDRIVNTAMLKPIEAISNAINNGDSISADGRGPEVVDKEPEVKTCDAPKVSLQGSGDERARKRSASAILEDYASRCNASVVYQFITDGPQKHKSNVFVVRGELAGFTATSLGDTEDLAKNGLATMILLMVAERQMNGEKLTTLLDLSREEMLEIMELDTENKRSTSQSKLYKLCLERAQELPRYTVEKAKTYQGITYVATCTALGFTAQGRGVRDVVAKKTAADELYRLVQGAESRSVTE